MELDDSVRVMEWIRRLDEEVSSATALVFIGILLLGWIDLRRDFSNVDLIRKLFRKKARFFDATSLLEVDVFNRRLRVLWKKPMVERVSPLRFFVFPVWRRGSFGKTELCAFDAGHFQR